MRELFLFVVQLFVAWRGLLSFLLCFSISIFLISLENKEKVIVMESITSTLLFPVQSLIASLTHHSDLNAENIKLRQDNAKLRLLVDRRYQESLENVRLRQMLGVPVQSEFPVAVGIVVARDVGSQKASCTISLGSSDSIQIGMPVYTLHGIVGQISRVDYNSSEVQLLNAPFSRVSVLNNRSREVGILESLDGRILHISSSHNSDFKVGDEIISSGLGGVYPKGMPVGRVYKIDHNQMQMMAKVIVQPYQNLLSFEEVFVLRKADIRNLQGEESINVVDSTRIP